MNKVPHPMPHPTNKQLAKLVPPTRWEITFALFALATGIYFLLDAGSWDNAPRLVRALLICSLGAMLLLGVKIVAIAAMKRRMNEPPAEKSESE